MRHDDRLLRSRPSDVPARDVVVVPSVREEGHVLGRGAGAAAGPLALDGDGVAVGSSSNDKRGEQSVKRERGGGGGRAGRGGGLALRTEPIVSELRHPRLTAQSQIRSRVSRRARS